MEEFEDWLRRIGEGGGRNQPNGRSIICEITFSNYTYISIKNWCPDFLSFAVLKHSGQNQFGEERDYLVYASDLSPSLKKSWQELMPRPEDCCLLFCSPQLLQPAFSHNPGPSAQGWLSSQCPGTSITNQENGPDLPTGQSDAGNFLMEAPSSLVFLACFKSTKTNKHPKFNQHEK